MSLTVELLGLSNALNHKVSVMENKNDVGQTISRQFSKFKDN